MVLCNTFRRPASAAIAVVALLPLTKAGPEFVPLRLVRIYALPVAAAVVMRSVAGPRPAAVPPPALAPDAANVAPSARQLAPARLLPVLLVLASQTVVRNVVAQLA